MNPYDINEIAPRDLVMLELYMTRFKTKKAGETKRPATWIDWRAQFELRSINFLSKSMYVEQEEQESDVYI
jgi:hypothetical protein